MFVSIVTVTMPPPFLPFKVAECCTVALLWSSFLIQNCWASNDTAFVHRSYRYECPVDPDIVTLHRNPEQADHYNTMDDNQHQNHDDEQQRHLVNMGVFLPKRSGVRGANTNNNNGVLVQYSNVENQENDWAEGDYSRNLQQETVQAHSCTCYGVGPIYCPLSVDHCAAIRRYDPTKHGDSPLGCIEPVARKDEFAETSFLISFLWFCLLLPCVLCTSWGRQVIHFFLAQCIPGYNRALAKCLLRRNRELANAMMHRQVNSQRLMVLQRLENVSPELASEILNGRRMMDQTRHTLPEPKRQAERLELKTRILNTGPTNTNAAHGESSEHCSNNNNHDNTQHEQDETEVLESCIICFQPFESGDRVGDLPCNHIFHADCLKAWLKRRNACPLCNARDVATPRFDTTTEQAANGIVSQQETNGQTPNSAPVSAENVTTQQVDTPRQEATT